MAEIFISKQSQRLDKPTQMLYEADSSISYQLYILVQRHALRDQVRGNLDCLIAICIRDQKRYIGMLYPAGILMFLKDDYIYNYINNFLIVCAS